MSGRADLRSSLKLRSDRTISARTRAAILDFMQRRDLQTGDRLPSEAEMSHMFNVSRPTLREALKLLEQEGLVQTIHGRGRFLSMAATLRVERPITAFESITGMLRELGYRPRTRVIALSEHPADKTVARALRCRVGTPVVHLERLRLQGQDPLVYCVEIVRRDSLPDRLDESMFRGSLNDLLGERRRRPRMSSASVSAVKLPPAIARILGQRHGGPWLLITETCFTDDGEAVVFARDYHRGDAFSFNFSRRMV